jgi:hypothetical protein
MLVSEGPDDYRTITQPDHSRQVGTIAREWGNDRFDASETSSSTAIAAELHDNGWWENDLRPGVADGAPAGVRDVAPQDWTGFYETAVERTGRVNEYAAVLVSMHGTGVRRQRYGLDPSMPDRTTEYAEFVARQERRQRELLSDLANAESDEYPSSSDVSFLAALHDAGSVDAAGEDSPLWGDYRLLQFWDKLSLYLCRTWPLDATTFESVPTRQGADDLAVAVEPVGEFAVRVDPYPFESSPLAIPVTGRSVPKKTYTESSLTTAYYQADLEQFPFEVRR